MDIMDHGAAFSRAVSSRAVFSPAVGRTPGGYGYAVAVDEAFPPLPTRTARVVVGVVDTGIALDDTGRPHPWFDARVIFGNQDDDPLRVGAADAPGYLAADDGHGTFVTGLILHEAPTARVIMRGVLDKSDDATDVLGELEDALVADAVRSLGQDPDVQVINLSFDGRVFTDKAVPANLGAALAELDHTRVAVVAAAGNAGSKHKVWPAAFRDVIAVGAVDERWLRPPGATPPRARFSNHGKWVTAYAGAVQVLGPFVYVEETGISLDGSHPPQHFRGWARWSGTSFAAATVSGRIAQTAIETGLTGAQAAKVVLDDARVIFGEGAVWVRGAA